jgi:hypothetical protein
MAAQVYFQLLVWITMTPLQKFGMSAFQLTIKDEHVIARAFVRGSLKP